MGSDTTKAPFGIVYDAEPLKVTFCSEPVSMELLPAVPLSGRAMVTAVMGKSVVPNAFEKRKRTWDEGAVMWIVCLRVALVNTPLDVLNGAGGRFAGSVSCGMDAQAVIQCPSVWLARTRR